MSILETALALNNPVAAWHTIRQTSPHYQAVSAFMLGGRQKVPQYAMMPEWPTRLLRARLLLEETLETVAALGVKVTVGRLVVTQDCVECSVNDDASPDLVEVADGCADIAVVATGTLVACGLADMAIQEEVNDNNMLKLGPGHRIDGYGKLLKPEGHPDPRIEKIVKLQLPATGLDE